LDNLETKNIVAEALFDYIEKDEELKGHLEEQIKETLFRWLVKTR
jgi:hypothetical protein